jgi:glycosyltransferase involved in cell wall biosynthesis
MSTTTPSVMTAHGTYSYIPHLLDTPLQRAWSRFATRRAYTRLAHIYAVSTYTKKHLLRFAGWTNQALDDRIHIIPNGVSVVAPLSRIPHDPHEIILVGGVKRRKGALEAIDAVHAYAQKYGERVALRIIGFFEESAPYVKTVRDRIQKYQCEATITLDGELSAEQLVEQYRKTDALIMLSVSSDQYFEGFGLVFLEANAYGVPVVGARGSGAEDAIRTNESGILISQATASEEAADALHTLFSDAVRFEHGAREWAAVHDWSRIGARYIKCYDEVIKSHE